MSDFRVGLSGDFTRPDGKATFPSCDLSPLGTEGMTLETMPRRGVLSADDVHDFDAVVLMGERVTPETLAGVDRLTLIARMGVGYDTIDVPACTAAGVALTMTPDAVRRPMASALVTFILALAHRLMEKDRITRTGSLGWPARLDFHGTGLVGRTVGSVGIGNIGAEMFRLLKPFDVRMIAHDPYVDQALAAELGIELVSLDAVFSESDFLTFNCPLTDATRGIGSREGIAKMKPSAYLINTSRGPVVDQNALYGALVERRIAGAAIDVFDPEPPSADDPILALDTLICAPHALGWTDQMFETMGLINADAVRAVRTGEAPKNIVNRDVVDAPAFQAKLARLHEQNRT